ncbi:hemopexin [Pogona vitticeps]
MRCAVGALYLCSALGLALAYPFKQDGRGGGGKTNGTGSSWHHLGSYPSVEDKEPKQRCSEEGFDAITMDEAGAMLFFKGDLVWKGFAGAAELKNASWPEIQGPVDAALRIHHPDRPSIHDNVYLFQGKHLWAYAQGRLKDGYPRLIEEEFPGIPGDLDAAVECHAQECSHAATIFFFKGTVVYSYDLTTKELKQRSWPSVANCSAAVRWLGRYYCFQGIQFLRFDPVTGQVGANYPRDARDYFMRCPGRGHGHHTQGNATARAIADRCSGRPFQAFFSDDTGRIYAFREGHYFQLDSHRDGWHAWPLKHLWKDLEGDVDAAFSWDNKLYLVQGSQVTIYQTGRGYIRVDGYPRPLQAELGVAEADATFTCPRSQALYIIHGNHLRRVDLELSPGHPGPLQPIPHAHVDGALCTSKGVFLFHGSDFHHYADVDQLIKATAPAPAKSIVVDFFHCPPPHAVGQGAPSLHHPQ